MAASKAPKSGKTAPHQPTEQLRTLVKNLAIVGLDQHAIAKCIGIARSTLRKHYRQELTTGSMLATAEVCGRLYERCMAGDVKAMIFWMRARAGWSERMSIDHSSIDGSMTQPRVIQVVAAESKP